VDLADPADVGAQIINGTPVGDPNPYPWFAMLFVESSPGSGSGSICGSVLIDPSWLMTAAHCVDKVTNPAAVLPFLGITTRSGLNVADALPVSQVILHPGWDAKNYVNDLALLRLSSPVAASRATPVPIADASTPTAAGTPSRSIGFGKTSNFGQASATLLQGNLSIVAGPNDPRCGAWSTSQYLPATMICANGRTASDAVISTCQGDSGGPLFVNPDSSPKVVGVVSFGAASACDSRSAPPVYTRVSAFRAWISTYVTSLPAPPPLPPGSPRGNLEAVSQSGPQAISVVGWALDPEVKTPVDVHVYVGGRFAGQGRADRARPDIASAYPWYGANHGFSITASAPLGGRQPVCAYAINVGAGGNALLGCKTIDITAGNPLGNLEVARADGPGRVAVAGWALDFDTTGPVKVHVYVDGKFAAEVTADQARPDVGRAFPGYGPNHGFSGTLTTSGGSPNVCAYAINVGAGETNPMLGCRRAQLPTGNPLGNFERLVPGTGGTVRASGWALDPDTAGPTTVHVYVDGKFAAQGTTVHLRPDVARAYPGWGNRRGFAVDAPAGDGAGPKRVCVYAINAGPGTVNTLLGCKTVTTPPR
jgi:hypothetical protein